MSAPLRLVTYIIMNLAVALFIFFVAKSNEKAAKKSKGQKHIIIRTPRTFLWVGIFACVVMSAFLYCMIFYPNGTEQWWVFVIFGAFDLLGIYIIVNTLVWRIDIFKQEDYFLYRPTLFKTHKIKYEDCISYSVKDDSVIIIKTNKKTVTANLIFTNCNALQSMLIKYNIKRTLYKPKKHK